MMCGAQTWQRAQLIAIWGGGGIDKGGGIRVATSYVPFYGVVCLSSAWGHWVSPHTILGVGPPGMAPKTLNPTPYTLNPKLGKAASNMQAPARSTPVAASPGPCSINLSI